MTEADRKKALRRTVKGQIAALSAAYMEESDAGICDRVLTSPEWEQAKTIFVYWSIGREVSTRALIASALAAGKTVALPRCGAAGYMEAVCVQNLSALKPGALGILEPAAGEVLVPEMIDLALVPALCFDLRGFRLGQGGGYYDRWLEGFSGLSLGLCREKLVREALPVEAHDRPVCRVLTEVRSLPE